MLKDFKRLSAATERLMLEDDTAGNDADVTARVEVEIEANTQAEEEAEVMEESAEVDETIAADDATMMAFARLQTAYSTVSTFGYSQPLAMIIDPDNSLPQLYSDMPAYESLGAVGSPDDQASQIALEAISGHLKNFWDHIMAFCRWVKEKVLSLFDKIAGLFKNRISTVKKLLEAVKKANIDPEKLKERKVKLITADQWKDVVTKINEEGAGLVDTINLVSTMSLEGALEPIGETKFTVEIPTAKEASAIGWDAASCANMGHLVTKLLETVALNIPKAAKAAKASSDKLNAFAKKSATQDEKPQFKKNAEAASKALKTLIAESKKYSSAASKAVNIWMTATKNVLACATKA